MGFFHFEAVIPRHRIVIKVSMAGLIERILKNLRMLIRPELLVEELARPLISSLSDLGPDYST